MAQPRPGLNDEGDYLDIAVRAWTTPVGDDPRTSQEQRGEEKRVPDQFLVFDTETTTDPSQRLTFGSWRYLRRTDAPNFTLECLEEGIFYADDLDQWDPDGFRTLQELKKERAAAGIDARDLDAARTLRVEPLQWFLDQRLWRAAYELRAGVVCFNFPFDISRLAWRASATRNRHRDTIDPYEGGFSLALWGYDTDGGRKESRWRPRVVVKSIDSKRALKGFRSPEKIDGVDLVKEDDDPNAKGGRAFRGEFLDLRTLVFALTDKGHSLESACGALGVPYTKRETEHGKITREYIDYCREDTEATAALCEAATREFLKHPIALKPTNAYSPATIGKGYLQAMGISPILQRHKFDPAVLGHAMTAYFGGRAECRIRHTEVPVVYCDFLSMYPTVCSLMELWSILTARNVAMKDETAEVQALVGSVEAEHCFDPTVWTDLVGIAQIKPDADIVPVRARYGDSLNWQIGVNHLTADEPMWFTIADLVASKILTGKTPTILKAFRLRGSTEKLASLQPVDLLGSTTVDPREQDFFRTVVEERRRTEARDELPPAEREWRAKGLKVLANATSYGIYAQMTRRELGGGRTEEVNVHGLPDEPYRFPVTAPETAGAYTFPPLAAAITGGARLMLALLEHKVTEAGGSYAFCDTDSMAIVSTKTGGDVPCPGGDVASGSGEAIRALSWDQVDSIREEFSALKPYDPTVVTDDLLELEDENFNDPKTRHERRQLWCYGISAKRYVLYNRGTNDQPTLRGWAELDTQPDEDTSSDQLLKPSEHGLGHLLSPTDPESPSREWIADSWRLLLRDPEALETGGPEWLDRPALAQSSVSSAFLLDLFSHLNEGKPFSEQIKPFNFMVTVSVPRQERPVDDQRMVLVAPYEKDPARWPNLGWRNRYSDRRYTLTSEHFKGYVREGVVRARTYRDVLTQYGQNPEAKSASSKGQRCGPLTSGLLHRRRVRVTTVSHVGKESNALEQAAAGLLEGADSRSSEYDDFYSRVFAPLVLPILRELGVRETARQTGHSTGAVSAALNKKSRPRRPQLEAYLDVAAAWARKSLSAAGKDPGQDPVACLRAYRN